MEDAVIMLRISKLADYSTVIMVHLAKQGDKLCNARDISAETHLALPTVSKLLKRLLASGLLISFRGVTGGYRLQRSPAEISIADIIYALEGRAALTECSAHSNSCSLQSVCSIQDNWRLISQAIETALESVSLEALSVPMSKNSIVIKRIVHLAEGLIGSEK